VNKINIECGDLVLQAEMHTTPTAKTIWDNLPLEGNVNVWGNEIYFDIGLDIAPEADAKEEVKIGDLAYWPSGTAFCIFFGATPVSINNEPRAYSPVNVFGHITDDPQLLKSLTSGTHIYIRKAG
jgi:hypothetical protein